MTLAVAQFAGAVVDGDFELGIGQFEARLDVLGMCDVPSGHMCRIGSATQRSVGPAAGIGCRCCNSRGVKASPAASFVER